MAKTKRAFAFFDFDEERILQRRYFKDFGFGEKTDEEILQSLKVGDSDTVDEAEKRLLTIKALHWRTGDLLRLIVRHMERQQRYFRHSLIEYATARWAVSELYQKSQKLYYEVEEKIQARYRKIFTERLRHYRKAAGLTQKELGEMVQVSQRGMSHYLRGERDMPTHTLIRVAKILDVSADELLGLK